MNAVQPRSSFQCDEPVRHCGCPPGHYCWHCLKDVFGDKLVELLLNHPDLVEILNATRMGVIDGSPAMPGQVGEYIAGQAVVDIPALAINEVIQTSALPLQLPPGDWMVFPDARWGFPWPAVAFGLSPPISGVSGSMFGGLWPSADPNARVAIGSPAQALLGNPVPLNFAVNIQSGTATAASTFTMRVQAYRIR